MMYLWISLTPDIRSVKRFQGKTCIFSENHSYVYKIHKIVFFVHTTRTERGVFMKKKELTEAEKKDLQMKMEIAEELGFADQFYFCKYFV